MATYLYRTNSSSSNTYTFSAWVKHTTVGTNDFKTMCLFGTEQDVSSTMSFSISDADKWNVYNGSAHNPSDAVARDPNAWYHVVLKVDNLSGTIYVNGESVKTGITCKATGTVSNHMVVGGYLASGNEDYFNGLMSHVHFCDGYAYNPTEFGSTDATTGEWKINTSPSVSYGTNGFFILKDGNSGTDQSGQGNNLTVSGTFTKTEDNPSNVFATFNPLTNWSGQNRTPSQVLANGNLKTGIGSSERAVLLSTIGVTSGKYYWEAKSDGVSKLFFGFSNRLVFDTSSDPHSQSGYNGVYYYEGTPDFRTYGSNTSTTGIASISTNDILGFALDMDNHAFYIHKNGTYMNSGSPTSGSSRTGSIAELFTYGRNCLSDYGEVFASAYVTSTSGSGTASFNFGNGYFGTQQVSSAGTNASGNGIFEYDVPTGYTALSTKGLNL